MSYTRWYYAFVLMASLASIKAIEEKPTKEEIKKSAETIWIISAIVVGIPLLLKLICAYLFPTVLNILPAGAVNYLQNAGLTEKFSVDDLRYAIVFIIMTSASYLPLFIVLKKDKIFSPKIVPLVTVICVVIYGCYISNEANIFEKPEIYKGNDVSVSDEVSYTHRTSYDYSFANYPQIANEPGIENFISFKSHSAAAFCNLVGYENTLHLNSKKYFDTPAIQSVLSIKTLVDENGNRTDAPYYTPFGFSYDYYVLSDNIEYTTSKKENNRRIEIMTKACFIDNETAEKLEGIVKPLNSDFNWKEECKKEGTENFIMTSSGFTATTKGSKERLIFFSIPHDNGWSAYVDGEETEIFTVNGGLMAIVVPEGRCDIEFRFVTPGLKAGLIISFLSISALFAYSIADVLRKRRA